MIVRRYPLAALASAMGCSVNQTGVRLGLSGSTLQDYRRRGVTERVADRLAILAGLHAHSVWPDMLDEAIAEVQAADGLCAGCPTPLLWSGRGRRPRWCSMACRERFLYATDPAHRERKRADARRLYATDEAYREAQRTRGRAKRNPRRAAA